MKIIIKIVCMCFMFAGLFSANGQTYDIPDINLKNKLISDYPDLMNAKGELIIAAANAFTAELNLDHASISDASGIENFTSIGIIRLNSNNLTSVPQLNSMLSLRRIYLSDNQLTSLPSFSNLTQLIGLTLINNRLKTIPTIQNITTLQYIYCANNQLTELPDMSALVNLKTLSVSFNPISALPDLKNTNLKQLDIKNTNINNIPSLPFLTGLEVLNCENNKFTDLSGLSANSKLITLTAQNNLIHSLPNFANKPLQNVNLSNNKLTFEDIIPLRSHPNFSSFTYVPQKSIDLPLYVDIRATNNYTYELLIDPSITTNQYTWYKNNLLFITNSVSSLSFTPVFMRDSGSYSATVTNSLVPTLTLTSNISTLTVRTCMEVNAFSTTILSSDCREGSKIDFKETIVEGALAPVHYTLQNNTTSLYIPGLNETLFEHVTPSSYTVTLTDSKNCSIEKIYIFDDNIDCDQAFSPNADGVMDDYFIADNGTAQIYNVSRKLVKTLATPAAWDGTTDNGNLADAGYYVIIVNGSSSFGISLMR